VPKITDVLGRWATPAGRRALGAIETVRASLPSALRALLAKHPDRRTITQAELDDHQVGAILREADKRFAAFRDPTLWRDHLPRWDVAISVGEGTRDQAGRCVPVSQRSYDEYRTRVSQGAAELAPSIGDSYEANPAAFDHDFEALNPSVNPLGRDGLTLPESVFRVVSGASDVVFASGSASTPRSTMDSALTLCRPEGSVLLVNTHCDARAWPDGQACARFLEPSIAPLAVLLHAVSQANERYRAKTLVVSHSLGSIVLATAALLHDPEDIASALCAHVNPAASAELLGLVYEARAGRFGEHVVMTSGDPVSGWLSSDRRIAYRAAPDQRVDPADVGAGPVERFTGSHRVVWAANELKRHWTPADGFGPAVEAIRRSPDYVPPDAAIALQLRPDGSIRPLRTEVGGDTTPVGPTIPGTAPRPTGPPGDGGTGPLDDPRNSDPGDRLTDQPGDGPADHPPAVDPWSPSGEPPPTEVPEHQDPGEHPGGEPPAGGREPPV
jgi:hypothetical protein